MISAQNCASFLEVFSVKHATDIRDVPLFLSLSVTEQIINTNKSNK